MKMVVNSMDFLLWVDAWISRRWYKKCIVEICKVDPRSEIDRDKIKKQLLDLIEKNGIPIEITDMHLFSIAERYMKWGFWYWVKKTEKKTDKEKSNE